MDPFIKYTMSKRISRIINDLRYTKAFINEDNKADAIEKLDLAISDLKEVKQSFNNEED